jgi:hypothetical protein
MDKLVEETVADGRWFPLRFKADQYQFAFIPAERHRETPFLVYLQPPANEMRAIAQSALSEARPERTDLHFILHLGFGGSTLLGKILAQPGAAITLQEPPIVTDLVRYRSTRLNGDTTRVLHEATRLLSRPIARGESVICKMTHVGNGLASSMAALHSTSQILCLQTPMQEMLLSLALRGMEGRISARRIFFAIHESKMSVVPLTDRDLAEHTDLELAALAWLSMQRMMLDAAARLGPQRTRSIVTADLMENTGDTLGAIARHFRLDLDVDALMRSGVLDRHSKTGEPFNAARRAERVAEGLRTHGAEIAPAVKWARKVAERTGIAWDLPYPLLGC